MKLLKSITGFIGNLFRQPRFRPGRIKDSPAMELETERRRGVRGL